MKVDLEELDSGAYTKGHDLAVSRELAVVGMDPKLTELPDLAGAATKLEKVDVSNNAFTALEFLKGHTTVKQVKATGNRIAELGHLASVPSLRILDVSENNLCDFDGVDRLQSLQVLVAAKNPVTEKGVEAISKLPKLNTLVLRHSPLQGVSLRKICTMPTLTKLSLSFCDLDALPWRGKAHRLLHLQELRLSGNRITALDPFLGGCAELRIIDFGNNQLADLSATLESLRPLSHLTHLTLKGNPFSSAPAYTATVKEMLPRLRYFDDDRFDDEGGERKKKAPKQPAAEPPKKKVKKIEPPERALAGRGCVVVVDEPLVDDADENYFTFEPTHKASQSERDSGVRRKKQAKEETGGDADKALAFLLKG